MATAKTTLAPAPAAAEEDKKQVRKETVRHPALQPDAAGNATVKVKEIPADFDRGKHKPFTKDDFECESAYFDWRADELEAKAKQYRRESELIKKGGDKKAVKKAKRLQGMMERMEALKAELAASGIDPDELLASMGGAEEEAEE